MTPTSLSNYLFKPLKAMVSYAALTILGQKLKQKGEAYAQVFTVFNKLYYKFEDRVTVKCTAHGVSTCSLGVLSGILRKTSDLL